MDDPSLPNDEGITALHNSVCAGHTEIVKFLVQFGVNVNTANSDGWWESDAQNQPCLGCVINNIQSVCGIASFITTHKSCQFITTANTQNPQTNSHQTHTVKYVELQARVAPSWRGRHIIVRAYYSTSRYSKPTYIACHFDVNAKWWTLLICWRLPAPKRRSTDGYGQFCTNTDAREILIFFPASLLLTLSLRK